MQATEKRVRRQREMNVQTAETKCAGNGKRSVQTTERKRADSNAQREQAHDMLRDKRKQR